MRFIRLDESETFQRNSSTRVRNNTKSRSDRVLRVILLVCSFCTSETTIALGSTTYDSILSIPTVVEFVRF